MHDDPRIPGDDFPHSNDETQEIPVVDGGVDYRAHADGPSPFAPDGHAFSAAPRPAPSEQSDYTILPSDAFAPKTNRKRRRQALTAVAGVVAVGAVVGGGFWLVAGDDEPSTNTAVTAPAPGPVSTSADELCPTRTDGSVTTGRDAGGTASGADVIKAFNYAYYVKRDANAVSEFVLPAAHQAVIPSMENLQRAIDSLPPKTTHCLSITDLGGGLNRVDLTQFEPEPDGNRVTFHQMIQTTNQNGRWLIVSNTAIN